MRWGGKEGWRDGGTEGALDKPQGVGVQQVSHSLGTQPDMYLFIWFLSQSVFRFPFFVTACYSYD